MVSDMKKILYSAVVVFLSSVFVCNAEAGDWMIRERITNFDPDTKTANTNNANSVNFHRYSVPEIDGSYYFNKAISTELALTAWRPNTTSTVNGANLGNEWLYPITTTLQYHFFADQPLLSP